MSALAKDEDSQRTELPAEYMFKDVSVASSRSSVWAAASLCGRSPSRTARLKTLRRPRTPRDAGAFAPRQRQLARQDQPGRTSSDDHHNGFTRFDPSPVQNCANPGQDRAANEASRLKRDVRVDDDAVGLPDV